LIFKATTPLVVETPGLETNEITDSSPALNEHKRTHEADLNGKPSSEAVTFSSYVNAFAAKDNVTDDPNKDQACCAVRILDLHAGGGASGGGGKRSGAGTGGSVDDLCCDTRIVNLMDKVGFFFHEFHHIILDFTSSKQFLDIAHLSP
jgi:hypothetical protein